MIMPKLTPEQKQEIYDVIAQIYEVNGVGGALHIVLDDLNVEDHHIKWCVGNEVLNRYPEKDQELYRRCAELLLNVHKKQRVALIEKALKRHGGKNDG